MADVWKVRGATGGGGFYLAPDPRLVVFLDKTPPPFVLRFAPDADAPRRQRAFYIPANVPLWSHLEQDHDFAHLDIHLRSDDLSARIAKGRLRINAALPRVLDESDTVLTLAHLVARQVGQEKQNDMMLDGLLDAILADILVAGTSSESVMTKAAPASAKGLNARQIAMLEGLVRSNLSTPPNVSTMAKHLGLSEGYFAHAFRDALSDSPSRWAMRQRLGHVTDMLLDPVIPLAQIAYATGFADQAHLSRAFRAQYGVPPSRWRKLHFSQDSTNRSGIHQDGMPSLS